MQRFGELEHGALPPGRFRTRDTGASEPLVRRSFVVECDSEKAYDPETRTWNVVASTDAIDSYDEIVDQSWDLSRYKTNPVILWSHRSGEPPLGTSKVKVEAFAGKAAGDKARKALKASIKFAKEGTSLRTDEIASLVDQGIIRMVSVGFRPGKVKAEEGPDGRTIYRLSKNTLFEISVTPIGANPEALGTKDGDPTRHDSAEFTTMRSKALEEFNAGKTAPPTERGKQTEDNTMAMTSEEMAVLESAKARANTAEAVRDDAVKSQKTAEGERDKSKTDLETLMASHDKALAEIDKAKNATVALEVKALVGKKITPAEEASMTKLAQTNRTMFDELIGARVEMAATKDGSVLGGDPLTGLKGKSAVDIIRERTN